MPFLGTSAGARLTVTRREGKSKPGVADRGFDPLSSFLNCPVGQPHDREEAEILCRAVTRAE